MTAALAGWPAAGAAETGYDLWLRYPLVSEPARLAAYRSAVTGIVTPEPSPTGDVAVAELPRLSLRLLNHWDNLAGTVERGYAGESLWRWGELPGRVDPRIADYARANASIGINGSVLNNVNASAAMLSAPYLEKAAAIARVTLSVDARA